jgi:CHRD domain-containing protein
LLNGAQETPPVNSPSQGVGFFTLDKETSALCYAISFSPLGGTEILAHIHGPGAPGQAAGILHNISPSPSPFGSPKHGCITLTKDEVGFLKKGLLYANVHSTIATNGEIRGQILPTKGVKYAKVPPIGSPSGAFLD